MDLTLSDNGSHVTFPLCFAEIHQNCVFRANSDTHSDLIRTAFQFNSDTVPI